MAEAVGSAYHEDTLKRVMVWERAAGISLIRAVAEGRGGDYQIKDERRLRSAACEWGIDIDGLSTREIAGKLASVYEAEFSLQEGKLKSLSLAPVPRQGVWDRLGIAPRGIDASIVEALHRAKSASSAWERGRMGCGC